MKTVIIGIDLGGTNTQGAAATLDGVIIRQSKIATRARLGSDTVIEDLAKLILDLAKGQPIKAVGLGVPGLLDLNAGNCRFSCNLGWQDVPIAGDLSRRIDAPVYICAGSGFGGMVPGPGPGLQRFYISISWHGHRLRHCH